MHIKGTDLQVGDVFRLGCDTHIVLMLRKEGGVKIWNRRLEMLDGWVGDHALVEVLSRAAPLTPAQQHADEMLGALKSVAGVYPPWHHSGYVALLNKIEPKPPTLEEAVALLIAVGGAHPDIAAFLERAKCN